MTNRTGPGGALSPQGRAAALAAMAAQPLDVLVVGAGVVGAGAALDAAGRGLRVGLVEARDLGSGTSSRSSKLVHGGLRYLKQLHFPLVFEALRERSLILDTLCPHLARPVEFVYPLERRFIDRAYVGAGVAVYDVLGAGKGVPSHHRHLSRRQTLATFPGAKKDAVRGGLKFYEGQLDDARHTMMLTRTAAAYGALVATSARVTGFLRDGDLVVGAQVTDLETGQPIDIRAQRVINAAGVWTDELQTMVGTKGQFRVHASKGVHILVPRDRIDSRTGLITETEKSLLFIIPCPWSEDFWVIGTTDTSWNLDLAHPAASQADIQYILDQANRLLQNPLTTADVIGVYAGLRPLLAGESDETSTLSREHAVVTTAPGLVVVAGGKYTTYRVMAKDAVDEAVKGLPDPVPPSCTERLPLVGAEGYPALWNARAAMGADTGLGTKRVEHLLGRYGSAVQDILQLVRSHPDLGEPLDSAPAYLRAEAYYAVACEGALHLDDILARRLRVSVDTWHRGVDTAPEVARLVAPLLGWDDATVDREIEHYRARVEAERDSQTRPTDQTADSARLGAPDVRRAATPREPTTHP
ncbi:MAG TPA: glycerol-3-phosphate dehydrogenase/oxidase [Nakamurella sp.]